MPKSLTTNLKTHLSEELTTLATCWKLVRVDGLVYGFTSHDHDIIYNDVLYEAAAGLVPTGISIASGLNVDNVDVSSFLYAAQINEVDLMSGRFDGATVDIFRINYESVADGVMYLAKGWMLGEVTVEDNQFSAELRGKAQKLQQNMLDQYGSMCRAHFGDTQCQIHVEEDYTVEGLITDITSRRVFIDSTRDEAEDVFAHGVLTLTGVNSLGSSLAVHSLTNASFESALDVGWVAESGSDQRGSVFPPAFSGAWYYKGNSGECKRYQEVSLLADGIGAAQIDSNELKFSVSWFQTSSADNDSAEIQLRFKDSSKVEISTASAGLIITAAQTWQSRNFEADIPVNTRYVDIILHLVDENAAGGTDSGIDYVHSAYTGLRSGVTSVIYPVPITNHSFETGDITGWTETAGGVTVKQTIPMSSKTAYDGDYFVTGNAGVGFILEQEIDLVSDVGLSAASIDAEAYQFRLSAYQLSSQFIPYNGNIRITCKDSSHQVLATIDSPSIAPIEWYRVKTAIQIPQFTRYVSVGVMITALGCSDPCQAYFDNVIASVVEYSPVAGYSMEVAAYDPITREITLYLPFPFELSEGDTYFMTWGCERSNTMCKDRYDNLINFRGDPFIPGSRALKGESELVDGVGEGEEV